MEWSFRRFEDWRLKNPVTIVVQNSLFVFLEDTRSFKVGLKRYTEVQDMKTTKEFDYPFLP